jgi:hypothetical protein
LRYFPLRRLRQFSLLYPSSKLAFNLLFYISLLCLIVVQTAVDADDLYKSILDSKIVKLLEKRRFKSEVQHLEVFQ